MCQNLTTTSLGKILLVLIKKKSVCGDAKNLPVFKNERLETSSAANSQQYFYKFASFQDGELEKATVSSFLWETKELTNGFMGFAKHFPAMNLIFAFEGRFSYNKQKFLKLDVSLVLVFLECCPGHHGQKSQTLGGEP